VVKTAGGASTPPRRAPKPPAPPAPKPEAKKPQPESASQKKESKITSVLKKTGRLLKKPFKF
jgi:hypothetical protein